jgi:DNA invertase Pin-like site-specific DNA recombinase
LNIGYARVSTAEQNLTLQIDALDSAGCERILVETASGAQRDRPELIKALDYMRSGDTLVVWKLDRLGRSMRQLIDTVELLQSKGVGFRSLVLQLHIRTSSSVTDGCDGLMLASPS